MTQEQKETLAAAAFVAFVIAGLFRVSYVWGGFLSLVLVIGLGLWAGQHQRLPPRDR